MNGQHTPTDLAQVESWLDGLAAHQQATERIMAMGSAALEPLLHYLERGPQLVSQPRVFAVTMLARLHDPRVPHVLRRLLHDHLLHGLPALLAESEYWVKDAVVEAMVYTQACATMEDIAFAMQSERLPAAVHAAGVLHLSLLAPALAGLLTDDVLAASAAVALSALQPESVAAVTESVRSWLDTNSDTTPTRRCFGWMAAISAACESALQERGMQQPSTLVRAAAALSMHDARATPVVAALVHGALGSDVMLALAGRQGLQDVDEMLFDPAMNALCGNSEPDIYGNLHPAEAEARQSLLLQLLQQTTMNAERFLQVNAGVPVDEFAACLCHWDTPRIETLKLAPQHGDTHVRIASAIALGRVDGDEKVGCLADLLDDIDHIIRRQAYRTLRRYLATRQGKASLGHLPPAAWWRSPRRCIQLIVLSARVRK